jgi:hypothetical protein
VFYDVKEVKAKKRSEDSFIMDVYSPDGFVVESRPFRGRKPLALLAWSAFDQIVKHFTFLLVRVFLDDGLKYVILWLACRA